MIINKITIGFVIQQFDTATNKCIKQDFIAGDQVDYEDNYNDPIDIGSDEAKELYPDFDPEKLEYQPFDMIQPKEKE